MRAAAWRLWTTAAAVPVNGDYFLDRAAARRDTGAHLLRDLMGVAQLLAAGTGPLKHDLSALVAADRGTVAPSSPAHALAILEGWSPPFARSALASALTRL